MNAQSGDDGMSALRISRVVASNMSRAQKGGNMLSSHRSKLWSARTAILPLIALIELIPAHCAAAVVPEGQLAAVNAASRPGTRAGSTHAAALSFTPKWATGGCDSLLPGGFGGVPGQVDTVWVSLQQQVVSQVEGFYGQNSSTDIPSSYALVKARGVTRALMFATLVQAIKDVHAGTATADEISWVNGFSGVVQYGREWMTIDAINRWNTFNSSSAFQSTVSNNIVQLFFGLIGLPWQNEPYIPTAQDLLNESESALWGPPAATADAGNGDIQNYPLGTAESATALQEMAEALAFLNAIGHTQVVAPGSGTDSTLTTVMANIENAIGTVSAGEMAEGVMSVKELSSILASGEGGTEHAAVFTALANSIWTLSSAVDTATSLNSAESKAFNAPDLYGALADPHQFAELVNDFAAITLHSLPGGGFATGNDPDCRTVHHSNLASPPSADATLTVAHYWNNSAPDYSYTTQVLGGNVPGTIGPTPDPPYSVNFPAVLDWSYGRDVGPGAPRLGANWPISEISYGVPGSKSYGWDQRAASPYYPWGGYWYITFDGADGTPHATAPLHVYVDSTGVHPTDSEVANAIVAADPLDFPTVPCNQSGARSDVALSSYDAPNWPCLDWNPGTHLGTMLVVRGDQWDNNKASLPNYQVIFDILVKGDTGLWSPVFVGHGGKGSGQPSDCEFSTDGWGTPVAGVCLGLGEAAPFAGDVVESKVLWPQQQNDVCSNDPYTCTTVPSYGWATPYPIWRECQSISPAAGMFVIEYAGQVDPGSPSTSCDNPPNGGSWDVTPSIHYRSVDGDLWVAWRVPPTIGTANFLNIHAAQHMGGSAGMVLDCGSSNGICVEGSGTHWLSEFSKGDGIMFVDPSKGQNNAIGGYLSFIRKVDTILDDTHMHLSSSVECLSGSDGNDCDMFSTAGYTSFMNPFDGTDGQALGMLSPCSDSNCVPSPTDFRFDIYKMTEQNPGTTCPTWDPSTAEHPPTSGCYYSNAVQFEAQTYAAQNQNNSWWNFSLPAPPAPPAPRPVANAPTSVEPWLDQPIITEQPQSVVVNAGTSPAFTATASGSPAPTVQWQRSTDSGSTWNNISGATNTTYTLNSVTSGQNGWAFRAVFANTNGTRTTQPATLGIYAAPQITLSPTSVPAAQLADPITLTSAATGSPQPSVEWQISSDRGATWNALGGGLSTLSLSQGPSPAPPLLVRVVYSNDAGTATSDIALVAGDDVFHGTFEQPPGP